MPASLSSLFLPMIYGFLCNANWILSSICIAIVTTATLVYYSMVFHTFDIVTTSIYITTVFFISYAAYSSELT